MDTSLVNKEKRHMCPYNNSHLIDPHRLPKHLMKCRKNYPEMNLQICPFNATHHIKEELFRAHVKECPDKSIMERATFLRQNPDYNPDGIAPYSFDCSSNECSWGGDSEENWDDPPENFEQYNPEKRAILMAIARNPPAGFGKSGRRQWREVDCLRVQRIKEGLPFDDLVYPTPGGGTISIGEILGHDTVSQCNVMPQVPEFEERRPTPANAMRRDKPLRLPVIETIFNSTQQNRDSVTDYLESDGVRSLASGMNGLEVSRKGAPNYYSSQNQPEMNGFQLAGKSNAAARRVILSNINNKK